MVGYQNLDTVSSGKKMVCPTFLNIGESNKVSLADLKVTGYDAPVKSTKGPWSKGCVGGKFILSKLNTSGISEADYYWIDSGNKTVAVGPGWFADNAGTPIPGGAESVKFESGVSFWTFGSGMQLVPAGAVNENDIAFATPSSGKAAIGNPTPVELTLADLTVTGYDAPVKSTKGPWSKGCVGGKFILSKLNTSGISEADYYWIDSGNKTVAVGPGWFADNAGTPIPGGAESVKIPAGQAYWTFGSGMTLVFPAPELDK